MITTRLGQPEPYRHPQRGTPGAPILVVCDPPTPSAANAGLPTSSANLKTFAEAAKKAGLAREDFLFVGLCPPLPEDAYNSDTRKWAHVAQYSQGVYDAIAQHGPRCIVPVGKEATRVVMGRSLAITKARGTPTTKDGRMVFPLLSPAYIRKVPDHLPIFEADLATLSRMKSQDFSLTDQDSTTVEYEWREDISDILALKPSIIAVDTETTGLVWRDPNVRVLTVQICWAPGKAVAVPVDEEYWPAWKGRGRERARVIGQLRQLLEDPTVRKVGHHLKFDVHMLRKLEIELKGWSDDTQLMVFAADENMLVKSLDESVRRWVPAMAGYADLFNATVNKADMLSVPHDKMLTYACGDVDADLRLYYVLRDILRKDARQYNCYTRIMMPGIKTFAYVIERFGMQVDQDRLQAFSEEVEVWLQEEYRALIQLVPPAVRRKHLDAGQELKFSRPSFVRDILFSKEGFRLKPVVFTKTTANLPDDQKEPSTSSKDHLPYFTDRGDAAGDFVTRLIEFQKTIKLHSTYLVGFWKYIAPNGAIYPSYSLSGTNTGRSSSQDPNGQNFPKRGRWAKAYQRIFKARPGYKLVNCDLSQIELRIAAWMSRDPFMLKIYRMGGDIHTATAKAVAQLSDAQWDALSAKERKALRTKAKAVNFGFLYGMWWKKFIHYAKVEYGVVYSPEEAKNTRELFFKTYRRLAGWHEETLELVKEDGTVRALHGAVRRLPSVFSDDEGTRMGAGRQAINAPVQRFGSDLGIMAMVRFSQQADPDKFRIIGFVHDALVMEVKDGYEKEGVQALLYAMENLPLEEWFGIRPPLPIKAEADIGLNGGEMLEFADLPPAEERPDWFNALGFETVSAERPDWWNTSVEEEAERELAYLYA